MAGWADSDGGGLSLRMRDRDAEGQCLALVFLRDRTEPVDRLGGEDPGPTDDGERNVVLDDQSPEFLKTDAEIAAGQAEIGNGSAS